MVQPRGAVVLDDQLATAPWVAGIVLVADAVSQHTHGWMVQARACKRGVYMRFVINFVDGR